MAQSIEEYGPGHLSVGEAETIVMEAAHRYFDGRRARVDSFIGRHFSILGSLALHRKALGWDLLRAPANIALALPYFGAQLTARIARRLGAERLSRYLAARPILLKTAGGGSGSSEADNARRYGIGAGPREHNRI